MSEKPPNNVGCALNGAGWLFLALLLLRVTGIWEISWLWVFAPFWLPLAFLVFVLVGSAILSRRTRPKETRTITATRVK